MNYRKPTEQKKKENTIRKDREPKAITAANGRLTKAPAPRRELFLSKLGKHIFKSICDNLIEQKRLTQAEVWLISLLAKAYSDYYEVTEKINTEGFTILINNGATEVRHPLLITQKEKVADIVKLSQQLGVTPFTQSSLNLPPPTEEDPAADYLSNND